jgi:GH24 family phage-related lysozyme (muramidase)
VPDVTANPLVEAYLPICAGWEGTLRTMYRDTLGNCTVADGLLLPTMASALVLPFQSGTMAATSDQIANEYNRVMAMPKGLRAQAYANLNSPTLAASECMNLLRAVVTSRVAELTKMLPCYASLPFSWQLALLDLAYNLGTHGLSGFPHLIAGVESGNAQECISQCNRPQLPAARNDWTRAQFAAATTPTNSDA